MIIILSIGFVLYEKYMSATNGQNELFLSVYLLKFENDTATSKTIAIIIMVNKNLL